MTNQELIAIAQRVLVQNYRQQPIVLRNGRGAELWDADGKRYLDMTAGIAVCSLGHSHPTLTARVAEQLTKVIHTSNLYFNEPQIRVAKAITDRSFADRVYFCNSGAEANESALKLARRYQQVVAQQPTKIKFVATDGSFHGRTFATVAVTGQSKYRQGFGPLLEPVEFVPYGDLFAARTVLEKGDVCCVIVEPIQAEGGIVVAPPGYLAGLRELCDQTGALLVIDEVQTGIGRTGKWFGHDHDGVVPDVMTLAKGLGGGVPIGALAATEKAAAGLTASTGGAVPHASTFGGNPLACAAALAVIEVIDDEGLLDRVAQAGDYLAQRLGQLVTRYSGFAQEVRGRGLLRGLAIAGNPAPIVGAAREEGLLLSVAGDRTIRFAPPFVVDRAQLDEAVATLDKVLATGAGRKV